MCVRKIMRERERERESKFIRRELRSGCFKYFICKSFALKEPWLSGLIVSISREWSPRTIHNERLKLTKGAC